MWTRALSQQHLIAFLALQSFTIVGCTEVISEHEAFTIEEATPSLSLSQQEIRYGVEDGTTHPSVVKLIMRVGSQYSLCSGSVIHESAVLINKRLYFAIEAERRLV